MRIAIVHYHLQTGGVTRIIQHAVAALREQGYRTVVLCGEPPEGEAADAGAVAVVPGLAYQSKRTAQSAVELAAQMDRAARRALGGAPDLWHVHNHALGKNLALPGAVQRLAEQGQRLLLQIHDFAEDGRPDNYRQLLQVCGGGDPVRLQQVLYPAAYHVHYAVLNSRDYAFMGRAGLAADCLYLLPNPVAIEPVAPSLPTSNGNGRLWLYATRAIRRKNLGELLLWAALADEGDRFAVSQVPLNPAEQPLYRQWVALGSELQLPVEFGAGLKPGLRFADLLSQTHALVTTSVAEGFGLGFLEPWLAGRPLAGRNLPEITREMDDAGVSLSHLYGRLEIPLPWLGYRVLERRAERALEQLMQAYGRRVQAGDPGRVMREWVRDDQVDFGRLDPELQQAVIRRIVASSAAREEISPQALPLPDPLAPTVADNRAAVASQYGIAQYGERLNTIYNRVLASPVVPPRALDGAQLLDAFLAPERLFLLRGV